MPERLASAAKQHDGQVQPDQITPSTEQSADWGIPFGLLASIATTAGAEATPARSTLLGNNDVGAVQRQTLAAPQLHDAARLAQRDCARNHRGRT